MPSLTQEIPRPPGPWFHSYDHKVWNKAMTVHCAECGAFICRTGHREAAPEDCPMREDFPDFEGLYPPGETRDLLVRSALVEAAGYCRWTRAREIMEFSRRMEYQRLGLPHCPDMKNIAERTASLLADAGFHPILPRAPEPFDSAAQARHLGERGAEMNVLAGMCVAHEALFVRESQAPVVGLVARDVRLRHNPAAAIYTSRSYLKSELFGHWKAKDRPPFRGWDTETLLRAAEEGNGSRPGPRSRLAEALDLIYNLGVTRLGISFCVGFRNEAEVLNRLLKTNGFQVSSACCKTGSTPKEDAGIGDEQKVRPGTREMICNPLAQAELLNRDEVQFAFVLGQCVGHDAATLRALDSPAICLVVKDRVLAHNTVAGLDGI